MTHAELSLAVHELGARYGSRDTHTSECLTISRTGRDKPYYYAQIWFSREGAGDVVGVMVNSAEEALDELGIKLNARLLSDTKLHPMARHAAILMAAEIPQ